jgi:hypothetical protein
MQCRREIAEVAQRGEQDGDALAVHLAAALRHELVLGRRQQEMFG